MLFERGLEPLTFCKRGNKRSLSDPAGSDDCNEFAHVACILTFQGTAGDGGLSKGRLVLITKGRRIQEVYIRDEPVSILLLDGNGLRQ